MNISTLSKKRRRDHNSSLRCAEDGRTGLGGDAVTDNRLVRPDNVLAIG